MNRFIKVSVIVNLYNEESFAHRCIQSILDQTYRNIEIILVDDGSEDRTFSICQEFELEDSRVKALRNERKGLVSSRKKGINESSGEAICYVDGDDWLDRVMIETLVASMDDNQAQIVIAGHVEDLMDYAEHLENNLPAGLYDNKRLEQQLYPCMLNNGLFSDFGVYSYLWGKLFKREVIFMNQMSVPDEIFIGEDASCLYPTLLDADRVYILSESYYHYRQRPGSLVKSRETKGTELYRLSIMYSYLKQRFTSSKYSALLLPQLEQYILSILMVRVNLADYYTDESTILPPFAGVQANDRLVLYGAGTFGQQLYGRLLEQENIRVVAWIDLLANQIARYGLPVADVISIKNLEYDWVIVAFINENISHEMKQTLIKDGIPEEKIIEADFRNIDLQNVLSAIAGEK